MVGEGVVDAVLGQYAALEVRGQFPGLVGLEVIAPFVAFIVGRQLPNVLLDAIEGVQRFRRAAQDGGDPVQQHLKMLNPLNLFHIVS